MHMCGRYRLSPENSPEIADLLQCLGGAVQTGEIFPTSRVPVLMDSPGVPQAAIWGYPRISGKSGAIINARSETALERPMFRKSMLERRCVFPATGFYEWGAGKTGEKPKYLFQQPRTDALYLAGLWSDFAGERRCVILTTEANDSMREIHDRMPLILDRARLRDWMCDTAYALHFLRETPPPLRHTLADSTAQLRLF